MNQCKSNFTVLDSYSVWTVSASFKEQYSSVTQYKIRPGYQVTQSKTEISEATFIFMKVVF
jgi:hypothetical protein